MEVVEDVLCLFSYGIFYPAYMWVFPVEGS